MAETPILESITRWECPSCGLTDVTRNIGAGSRFHDCRALAGLSAPMVVAGTKAKHVVNIREDYTNGDEVHHDANGRVVMSLSTVRDDGIDCTVYAPAAHGRGRNPFNGMG